MNEFASGRSRELEPPPPPIVGDIITARDFNYERPAIVVEVVNTEYLQAIGITDETTNQYTMPGTVAVRNVIRTVGHKNFDEVVEALTMSLAFGQVPTAELRAKVRNTLSEQLSRRSRES